MTKQRMIIGYKDKLLILVLLLLISLLAIGLFKNIAYPLLWNDEAETAMYAKRVLEYGYPKVHNGKNVLYLLKLPFKYGVREKSDAYIGGNWGHYYFSTIGVAWANKVDDIYSKTALLRIPFVLLGLIGVLIWGLAAINLFKGNLTAKLSFLSGFLLLELLSISLILHLREVRYYSLVVFLSAGIFCSYINYRFFGKVRLSIYILATTLLLFLLFNSFAPLYFILVIAIGAYEFLQCIRKRCWHNFIIATLPLLFSFLAVMPLLKFFQTFQISTALTRLTPLGPNLQYAHLYTMLSFLKKYEFLNLLLAVKIVMLILWLYVRRLRPLPQGVDKNEDPAKGISTFLSLFFLIHILLIIRMPLPSLYLRYFIVLQPILCLILLLDFFITFKLISHLNPPVFRWTVRVAILLLLCSLFILNGLKKVEHIKNYIYQIFHQYRGPLDFVIPYIKSNYDNPERLVIATNYEECSYMYYLDSRVIIGYVGNNLEEDLKMQPDIIIPRKRGFFTGPKVFNKFLQNGRYKRVCFAIFDCPVNNIPELTGPISHLFKTKMAQEPSQRLEIYIRQ